MTDMERYVVEEWAEEYKQGRLARREFLRRMALMSGGVALAVPLLRSLGVIATEVEVAEAASAAPQLMAQAPGVTVPADDPTLEASMTSFPSETGQVIGYLARPKEAGPYPAVLIIHENLSGRSARVLQRYRAELQRGRGQGCLDAHPGLVRSVFEGSIGGRLYLIPALDVRLSTRRASGQAARRQTSSTLAELPDPRSVSPGRSQSIRNCHLRHPST